MATVDESPRAVAAPAERLTLMGDARASLPAEATTQEVASRMRVLLSERVASACHGATDPTPQARPRHRANSFDLTCMDWDPSLVAYSVADRDDYAAGRTISAAELRERWQIEDDVLDASHEPAHEDMPHPDMG